MRNSETIALEKFIKEMVEYYTQNLPQDDLDWTYYWDYVNTKLETFTTTTHIVVDPFWLRRAISHDILTLEFGENDYGNLTL